MSDETWLPPGGWRERALTAEAEVARLRSPFDGHREWCELLMDIVAPGDECTCGYVDYQAVQKALAAEAEVARLRTALERIERLGESVATHPNAMAFSASFEAGKLAEVARAALAAETAQEGTQ